MRTQVRLEFVADPSRSLHHWLHHVTVDEGTASAAAADAAIRHNRFTQR